MTTRRWGLGLLGAGALLLCVALALPARPLAAGLPNATPTVDRLAAPPTVEHPSQADVGAQVFWLNCQPCHGDVGQGLTQDWINQYPPEDRNCWDSGCHGDRPYENGFTLPKIVPFQYSDVAARRMLTSTLAMPPSGFEAVPHTSPAEVLQPAA